MMDLNQILWPRTNRLNFWIDLNLDLDPDQFFNFSMRDKKYLKKLLIDLNQIKLDLQKKTNQLDFGTDPDPNPGSITPVSITESNGNSDFQPTGAP